MDRLYSAIDMLSCGRTDRIEIQMTRVLNQQLIVKYSHKEPVPRRSNILYGSGSEPLALCYGSLSDPSIDGGLTHRDSPR